MINFLLVFNFDYIYNIFFLFINILLILFIIFSINPVFSISYLILFFFFNFSLLIFLKIEFMAILFLVIYAGAISILFIFVVLLFDIKFLLLYAENNQKIYFFYFLSLIFFCLLNLIIFDIYWLKFTAPHIFNNYVDWLSVFYLQSELEVLGLVIFNYYYHDVFLLMLILFVAMIGIIILSLNKYMFTINKNFLNLEKLAFKKLFYLK